MAMEPPNPQLSHIMEPTAIGLLSLAQPRVRRKLFTNPQTWDFACGWGGWGGWRMGWWMVGMAS